MRKTISWAWMAVALVATVAVTSAAFMLLHANPSSSNNPAAQQSTNTGGGPGQDTNGSSTCTTQTCDNGPQSAGTQVVGGTITAFSSTSVTIKTFDTGQTMTYSVNDQTKMVSGPGDSLVAFDSSKLSSGAKVGIGTGSDKTVATRLFLNFSVQSGLTPQ